MLNHTPPNSPLMSQTFYSLVLLMTNAASAAASKIKPPNVSLLRNAFPSFAFGVVIRLFPLILCRVFRLFDIQDVYRDKKIH